MKIETAPGYDKDGRWRNCRGSAANVLTSECGGPRSHERICRSAANGIPEPEGGLVMPKKPTLRLMVETIAPPERPTRAKARPTKRRRATGSSPEITAPEITALERQRAEQALRASEARYRRLFETARDGILILDAATGTIMDSNPYLETMLGYSHAELLGKKLWEIGPFKDVAASRVAFRQLQCNEYIRYEDLPLETKNGERMQVEFISNLYLVDSAKVIQCNIRDITARKLAEVSIRKANESLSSLVTVLQRRDADMTLVSRMNDLLQSCETQEEAYRIIALTATELFVGQNGCVAVFLKSGQYLETVARWGDEALVEDMFPKEDCWALRSGRPHEVMDPSTNPPCKHFVRPPHHGYRCLPLTVHGGALGVFHLEAAPKGAEDQRGRQDQLAVTVSEAIKLSLANLGLRMKLQAQATLDPLTALFNRRYVEDTLPRELHRSLRKGSPLSVAMLDLDHFKQFNDTFGHDAGDLVLQEASRLLSENLRESDCACRYGGEEFLLVLPDASLEDTSRRLEHIRLLLERMELVCHGQLLGKVTFSAGVAVAPEHGTHPADLLRAVDEALYAAKQAGRNQVRAYRRA